MSKFTVVGGGLIPVTHIATTAPCPVNGYALVTRLCRPEDPVPWAVETLPRCTDEEVAAASSSPIACRACAVIYRQAIHPAGPVDVDGDGQGTPSLLSLL